MTTDELVEYDVDAGIATLRLNRPEVLNALTEESLAVLADRIHDAYDDPAVRCVVVTGNGRGFCSGGDVREMDGRDPTHLEWKIHLAIFQNTVHLLRNGPKPTVASINGPAVGAGMDMTLACDFRVMSVSAYLRPQFIDIGLMPGDGGGWLLPRLIGESRAKQYIMTNETITPTAAIDMGLVYAVVPDDQLETATNELATILRDKPRLAMQKTREVLNGDLSLEEYCERAIDDQWDCIHDSEHREAVSAFVEGREPDFAKYD